MAPQSGVGNALLSTFGALDLRIIDGTEVECQAGELIQGPGDEEVFAYFPLTAVLSLLSVMSTGATTEVALVGREGMVGLRGALVVSDSVTTCTVQVGGRCLRATTAAVRRARAQSAVVRSTLDRYTTARLVQVAQTAACNRLHPLNGRLARWLLGLHDRADGDAFKLSQQSIADALGAHRPTIAAELQRLHASGAIRYRSRVVRILDRTRLESAACECHHVLHRTFVDLFGTGSVTEPAGNDDSGLAALRDIANQLLATSLAEQRARERAESATKAKEAVLSLVSHELRTPLQAILGWCALGLGPQPPDGVLQVIDRNARAQIALLDRLLEAASSNADGDK